MNLKKHKYTISLIGLLLGYLILNAFRIHCYSFNYSEAKSDVAIVLGAGTNNGKLSPVFRERINHSIFLFKKGRVDKIFFTGGFGKGQHQSDSQVAKNYALSYGIPEKDILIEDRSQYTFQNLREAKPIMDSIGLKTALIISDPLHMKRAMLLAKSYKFDCKPSPTRTSMYQSFYPKAKLLFYETLYFSLREPMSVF